MATINMPLSLRDAVPMPGYTPSALTVNQSNGGGSGQSSAPNAFAFNSLVLPKTAASLVGFTWFLSNLTIGATPNFQLKVDYHSLIPADTDAVQKRFALAGAIGNCNSSNLLTKGTSTIVTVNPVLTNVPGVPAIGVPGFISLTSIPADGISGSFNSFVVKLFRDGSNSLDTAGEVRIHGVSFWYSDA